MTSGQPLLEVIAVNAADARAAEAGGADRIELVCAMSEGGLTPSFGIIEQVVSSVSIPVYVMIRPHSRSFCYNEDDMEAMKKDIRTARELGASGIVIGALTDKGEADLSMLQKCLAEAQGLGVTFHRAIDESASLTRTLDAISALSQIERVLTSGGKSTALEAMDELKQLSKRGGERNVAIMAGAGLLIDKIHSFVLQTGITELHFGSGVRREGSFHWPVDSNLVARAKQHLANAAKEL
ncbi:copper homeostasis protein [Paenibacillus algorifonticola]|uniref:PF03932 family protein CutC n=1 Tax=Paenibacillus algorifonticola TaxID=684063 RepID=A0A1I2D185_9BACL|nr:copper homeostasis protein CutC [Paenibacillus algorifonticola]SFE73803.1 copper homeostasis protein [Paenibacillus algorifonticola]